MHTWLLSFFFLSFHFNVADSPFPSKIHIRDFSRENAYYFFLPWRNKNQSREDGSSLRCCGAEPASVGGPPAGEAGLRTSRWERGRGQHPPPQSRARAAGPSGSTEGPELGPVVLMPSQPNAKRPSCRSCARLPAGARARTRTCVCARACGARAAICAPVRRTINICPDLTPLHGRADNLLEEQKQHWDRQPPAGAQGSGGQARRGRGAPGTRGLTGVRARPSGRCRPAVPQPPSLAARSAASSRSHARHSWLA